MPIIPVLASAILFNIRNSGNNLDELKAILPSIHFSLNDLSPDESIISQTKRLEADGEGTMYKEKEFVAEVEFTKNSVEAQIAALELLSNICCMEEWSAEMEDMEGDNFPSELKEFCLSIPLPKIMSMCQLSQSPLMEQIEQSPAVFSELTDFLHDRTSRAFACMSNFFAVINPTEFSVKVEDIWTELIKMFQVLSSNMNQLKNLEGVTSVMRSFLCNCPTINFMQDTHLQGIVSLCENLFSSEIRRCGISMLVYVTSQKTFAECKTLYEQTATLLLKKLGDENINVVNEAIEGVFEICGQDDTVPLCHSLQLLQRLKEFLPIFSTRLRQQQSLFDEETNAMLQGTFENLEGFIQYLQSI